jgi:hypothetical protein
VQKPVREREVETQHREHVAAQGGLSLKFTSPGRRSVPDRIDLYQIPPEHRDIVARYIRFTECKRPGEKPTEAQLREHERLRALGFAVDVVDQLRKEKRNVAKRIAIDYSKLD